MPGENGGFRRPGSPLIIIICGIAPWPGPAVSLIRRSIRGEIFELVSLRVVVVLLLLLLLLLRDALAMKSAMRSVIDQGLPNAHSCRPRPGRALEPWARHISGRSHREARRGGTVGWSSLPRTAAPAAHWCTSTRPGRGAASRGPPPRTSHQRDSRCSLGRTGYREPRRKA